MESFVEKRWIHTKKKIILAGIILLVILGIVLIVTHCDHVWIDATCENPKTCEKCGRTRGEPVAHSCIDATCTLPPVCRYCIQAQGDPLGHDWQSATCSKPESCKRCDATRGETAAHNLGTSTDGKTKPCIDCGESVEITYVALTFDDGPSGSITEGLLEGLESRNARATFFLCGYRIAQFPDHPALIASYGHEIGLHTENHSYLTKLSNDAIRSELRNELNRIPGDINVRLMRPPGGLYDDTVRSICSSFGLSIIMWSLDTEDWNYDDPSDIVGSITGAEAGDIILMHDIKSSSVEAALQAIDIMRAKGYEFVTVSELSEIMDRPLYSGEVYYSM